MSSLLIVAMMPLSHDPSKVDKLHQNVQQHLGEKRPVSDKKTWLFHIQTEQSEASMVTANYQDRIPRSRQSLRDIEMQHSIMLVFSV